MPRSKRSGLALQVLQNAHKNLESKLSGLHAQEFKQTSLEDARQSVLDTESRMAARGCLRNTRRLMPLFEGLHHYSKVIEVLCNSVPFMSFAWAPIKFIINVTCENVKAFDKIIVQYSRIGEALVRFKTLQSTFAQNTEFQQIVAAFYSDILEFNGEAYKFVTRSAWELFFLTSWGRFERRFESIMENLKAHEDLLDKTANVLNIAEARVQREALQQEKTEKLARVATKEKAKHARLYQEISAWLKVDDTEQALIFDSITQEVAKYPGTHDWVTKHDGFRAWLRDSYRSSFLWLQGSPGSGKTALANRVVAFLQTQPDSLIVRHFCDALTPSSTNYDSILRSLLFQLVRTNEDLVAYIQSLKTTEFLEKTVTSKALEDIIRNVSGAVRSDTAKNHTIHIIIDGLDVCEDEKQKRLIWLLERLVSPAVASTCSYKVLLVSRRTELLRKRMRNLPKISLYDEDKHVMSSIESYARQRFGSMRRQLHELGIGDAQIRSLSQQLAAKADGMFLWARLVLNYVSSNLIYHGSEIEKAINVLPKELGEFYEKILLQTLSNFDKQSVQRLTSMFGWIAYAKRPLKKIELQSAITFTSGNPDEEDVVPSFVLGLCSQLVEERADSTLALIHSSVKEYLQSPETLLKLSEQSALAEHATASITCLLSATRCFGSGKVDQRKQQQMTLRGLHAFQLYAQEHWVDYVILIGSSQSTVAFGNILHQLMHDLSSRLEEMHQSEAQTTPESQLNTLTPDDPRLNCIHHLPGLYRAGAAILKARSLGARVTKEDILAVGPSTPLGQILSRYQTIIRDILARRNVTGISLDKLANFQETHKMFAFTCRLGGCRRLAAGFETEKLRDQHEESHRSFLRCEAASCQYPPFTSARALQRHVREVHTEKRKRRPIRRADTETTLVNSRTSSTIAPLKRSLEGIQQLGYPFNATLPPNDHFPFTGDDIAEERYALDRDSSISWPAPKPQVTNHNDGGREGIHEINGILEYSALQFNPADQRRGEEIPRTVSPKDVVFEHEDGDETSNNFPLFPRTTTPRGTEEWTSHAAQDEENNPFIHRPEVPVQDSSSQRQSSAMTFDLHQRQRPPPWHSQLPYAQISIGWSVSETDAFPSLIQAFGSDWQAISSALGTKTSDMVESYYQERLSSKPQWGPLLWEADAKKARGEKLPDFHYLPKQASLEESSDSSEPTGVWNGVEDNESFDDDSDDKKYCTCRNVSYGDMVACDNDDCPYEWFHWSCVGLKAEPNGKWFCPICLEKMAKNRNSDHGGLSDRPDISDRTVPESTHSPLLTPRDPVLYKPPQKGETHPQTANQEPSTGAGAPAISHMEPERRRDVSNLQQEGQPQLQWKLMQEGDEMPEGLGHGDHQKLGKFETLELRNQIINQERMLLRFLQLPPQNLTPQQQQMMDVKFVPRELIRKIRKSSQVPHDIRTWKQFRDWADIERLPHESKEYLRLTQITQFVEMMEDDLDKMRMQAK